ncbi:TKL protein kinase [Saprolegnia parasitica CBS 223.65]|uniref:TKL protein kinase n=1 Tax=Saprolegnia parasitica (strain CBS 223.65) TaxID=695850 RepID=A0A067BVE8_SAPPC|nr:TKL protein kinase [Saprolegnia parasitica CBS 223.65]KDO22218.1 TKL protein kinase [Saprolegnia parasitica CBS 223.65]|eukprot:XP_012207058.1 TKL protein kinase [Saprolegnia parasitica CBS 223.65]
MDYGNLFQYLRKKREGEPVAMRLTTMQVAWVLADALADIHARGVIHRDVKSLNVLLSWTHGIKLGDFGSARTVDGLMTGNIGSQLWMAPEVFRDYDENPDGDRAYTTAADIFSFGVVVSEVHNCNEPYAGQGSVADVLGMVRAGRLRPTLQPKCPASLRKLVDACVAYDPTKRPTAKSIVRYLAKHMLDNADETDRDAFADTVKDVEDDLAPQPIVMNMSLKEALPTIAEAEP